MARHSDKGSGKAGSTTRQAEQLCITHCRTEDSVFGAEGFAVRAASSTAPELMRFALEVPGHQLPLDLWSLDPSPILAPRRLARLVLPDGRAALIHSSYLKRDTHDRPRSYLTHILVYPELTLREAAQSWAAPDWLPDYPQGAAKDLKPFPGVPVGTVVNDEALTAFLAADEAEYPADQNLATLVFPERLGKDARRRREWLALALAGCLRVLKEPVTGRARLYVHAEPGVVALLVYGIARLLPGALVDGLTFTTYESLHASLRNCRDARIVGTCTGKPESALDADYGTRRGFALDLWFDAPSPELQEAMPPFAGSLVALAAAGKWDDIDALHALWASDPTLSLDSVGDAVALMPVYQRLQRRELTASDLEILEGCALGQALRLQSMDAYWPQLWRIALDDGRICERFGEPLRTHKPDLERELCRAIIDASAGSWQTHWDLLKLLIPARDAPEVFRTALRTVGKVRRLEHLPTATRAALLKERQKVDPACDFLPPEETGLLRSKDAGRLNKLLPALPVRWRGQALSEALRQPARAQEIADRLRGCDSELRQAFCQAVQCLPSANIDDLLVPLFPQGRNEVPLLFNSLQADGLQLDGEALGRLLERAGADEGSWLEHWLVEDNLYRLGENLPPGNAFYSRLWSRLIASLNKGLLVGDEEQTKRLDALQAARKLLGERTPMAALAALDDWQRLLDQFTDPPDPAEAPLPDLELACQRRGIKEPGKLLRDRYARWLGSEEPLSEEAQLVLVHSAAGFYGLCREKTYEVLLIIVKNCPENHKRIYHRFFLSQALPLSFRQQVLQKFKMHLLLSRGDLPELLHEQSWWQRYPREIKWVSIGAGAGVAVLVLGVIAWALKLFR